MSVFTHSLLHGSFFTPTKEDEEETAEIESYCSYPLLVIQFWALGFLWLEVMATKEQVIPETMATMPRGYISLCVSTHLGRWSVSSVYRQAKRIPISHYVKENRRPQGRNSSTQSNN
jgi:hypothetical protein